MRTLDTASDMGAAGDPDGPDGRDWLDEVLVAAAREHRTDYLADAGFAARVVAALPAATALPAWRRPVILLLWTIAAAALLATIPDLLADLAGSTARWVGGHRVSLGDIATGILALAAASWGATVLVLGRSD